jgi:dihydroorotase/N-acyl-D-amino-acid deacylase
MRRITLIALLAATAACSSSAPSSRATPVAAAAIYPGADWERVSDPAAVGWSRERLDSVRAMLSHMATTAMIVTEHGRVVFEYGDLTEQSYLASVRKSVLSMLYGIEIARGKVDTSRTLAQLGIDDLGGLSPGEKEATVQDLLSARSGVYHPASNAGDNLADAPPRGSQKHGTYQLYSNWDFNAVGAIFEQQTGRNIYDAVEAEIARPIGMQDWRRDLQQKSGDTTASKYQAYHMYFSTRDMARIGYLMLRNGAWNGKQIVPADWVKKSTSAITPVNQMHPSATRRGRFGYGYLWWPFDGDWNTGPYEGAYSGIGAVGQYITVIPKLDIVIAHKTEPRAGSSGVQHPQFWALVDQVVAARTGVLPQPKKSTIPPYDVIVKNGTVIDGTGAPGVKADVAILGRRIMRVAPSLNPADAERVIDATGLIVAPGFIDMHVHLEPLMQLPGAESHVRQGVTLALGGPDGGGPWPLGTYMDSADRAGLGINVAYLTGHNIIRETVMGTENRAPTPAELARMKSMIAQAMNEGAFGISTGLRYIPGYYSNVDEVIALSEEAAKRGGIYTSHLREEGVGLLDGVAEALEIGRRAKIPVMLTHHKAIGRQAWGKSVITLAMVDSARKAGTDVMIDQYPFTASFTSLSVLIPPWALAGGNVELRKRLDNPVLKDSITKGMIDLLLNDRGGGDISRVQFAIVAWDKSLQGKTLADWAIQRGLKPTPENAVPLILEGVLKGGAGMVYHVIEEADVKRIMAHPMTMIASDGRLTKLGEGVPHPRNYGTFPRVLGKYVREDHVLTLEQAINKMTVMPAARLNLRDRGCLRAGCVADVTIFDASTVRDMGTFTDPHHYPVGIPWVLVNGEPVIANNVFTSARPGRVIRRPVGRQ